MRYWLPALTIVLACVAGGADLADAASAKKKAPPFTTKEKQAIVRCISDNARAQRAQNQPALDLSAVAEACRAKIATWNYSPPSHVAAAPSAEQQASKVEKVRMEFIEKELHAAADRFVPTALGRSARGGAKDEGETFTAEERTDISGCIAEQVHSQKEQHHATLDVPELSDACRARIATWNYSPVYTPLIMAGKISADGPAAEEERRKFIALQIDAAVANFGLASPSSDPAASQDAGSARPAR